MNIDELKTLWEERKSTLEARLSGLSENDQVHVKAKIVELTRCLHELDNVDVIKFLNTFYRVVGTVVAEHAIAEFKKINHKLDETMSAISEFAAKQQAHNDKLDAGIDGVAGDIQVLKDLIAQLQNSAGQITPEDQATLDALEKKSGETADKVAALDELTPPPPPPA